MQNMINNLMGDMWKNVGNMDAGNWMKDIPGVTDMDTNKIGLQILDFQKNVFETIYNAMLQTQEQAEKMVEPLLKNIPGVNDEWKDILKKNQEDIKKAVDENFVKAESYFSPAASASKKAAPEKAETAKGKAKSK